MTVILELEVSADWAVQFVSAIVSFEPRHEETVFFSFAKTKAQISCAVTAQLFCAFVFAT